MTVVETRFAALPDNVVAAVAVAVVVRAGVVAVAAVVDAVAVVEALAVGAVVAVVDAVTVGAVVAVVEALAVGAVVWAGVPAELVAAGRGICDRLLSWAASVVNCAASCPIDSVACASRETVPAGLAVNAACSAL